MTVGGLVESFALTHTVMRPFLSVSHNKLMWGTELLTRSGPFGEHGYNVISVLASTAKAGVCHRWNILAGSVEPISREFDS